MHLIKVILGALLIVVVLYIYGPLLVAAPAISAQSCEPTGITYPEFQEWCEAGKFSANLAVLITIVAVGVGVWSIIRGVKKRPFFPWKDA